MKNCITTLMLSIVTIASIFGQSSFESDWSHFLREYVIYGKVDYANIKKEGSIKTLVQSIEQTDISGMNDDELLSFYINSYNALVINSIIDQYPISSVKDVRGFFDNKNFIIGGKELSLNELEKNYILAKYNDPRVHFALVCGAKGCPTLRSVSFSSKNIDNELEMATKNALRDPKIFVSNDVSAQYSLIFDWYKRDFGGSDGIQKFIQKYTNKDISELDDSTLPYDWSLNDFNPKSIENKDHVAKKSNNSYRYISSATVPFKGIELKVFNNLYSQSDAYNRSSFFTTFTSFLYGVKDNFNVGFDVRYRRVHNDVESSSPFAVLGNVRDNGRQGITTIGPKIRWAPLARQFPNFSIQSAFWFAMSSDLQYGENDAFLDWDSPSFLTQFFNDKSLGDKFSLFTEIDIFLEDIGKGDSNRFSTPVTAILSYFPIPNFTTYTLMGYSPYWQTEFDYFVQAGLGLKYQFSEHLEIECLYTYFDNKYLASIDGSASTYNLGIRYSR